MEPVCDAYSRKTLQRIFRFIVCDETITPEAWGRIYWAMVSVDTFASAGRDGVEMISRVIRHQ
jgi:hypothetical protein